MTDRVLPNLPHESTDVTHVAPDGKTYRMFRVKDSSDECGKCAFEQGKAFPSGTNTPLTKPCQDIGDVCIDQGTSSVYFQIEKPE